MDSKTLQMEALRLSPEERAALAGQLIHSLKTDVHSDAEAAWSGEIRTRLAQLDAGTAKTIPWSEARDRIQAPARGGWLKELGPSSLRIAGFQLWVHGRQFPESNDADDGNWLRVTAHCAASGASVRIHGSLVRVMDIETFGHECRRLYDSQSDRATFEPLEPELRIRLNATDGMGHVSADIEITPDHLAQAHRMRFEIDQSYLPEIIQQCAAVVQVYPVRGS